MTGRFRALQRWALASRILLVGYILGCFTAVAAAVARIFMPMGDGVTIYLETTVTAGLAVCQLIIFLSMVTILLWFYRAYGNLRALGLEGLNYSPAWLVVSFFIPVVNLIVPFRATRELYNRSMGEEAWFAAESAGDVSSWWSCFVVGNLIQAFLIGMILVDRLTPFYFTTPPIANELLALFALALLGGSAFFLFRIIGAVTTAQQSVTGVGDTFA